MFPQAPVLEGRVLEVGVGPMGAIGFLPGEFVRVAVDPLAEDYSQHGLLRADYAVDLRQGRAEELPFEENEFDSLLCFSVLDHVMDPKAAIREMTRVTKPGGSILLSVHVVRPMWWFLKRMLWLGDLTHPHHMSLKDVQRLYAELCSLQGLQLERPILPTTDLRTRVANSIMEGAHLTLQVT